MKTIAVNPRNTSQDCSNCGKKVPKELNIRTSRGDKRLKSIVG
ncbi:MAG: transposase [Okeania sp. SIO2B3]|nr:transposase [Okeania sp. SIO2B3]